MKAFLLSVIFLSSFSAQAAQSLSTKIQSPYSSIRALGMGDAFTAVADDYSLIMYNPAGFARKKHNEIQVTLLGAGVSPDTLSVAKDISDASNTQGTDSQKAQAVSDVLEKYYGKSLGGKAQALELFWVRNGWGLALLPMDLSIDVTIDRQLGPAIDLNVKGDTTAAIGFGKELTKTLDAGLTAKYVHRVSVEEIVPALELATDPNVLSSKRFREGTAFDFDLGFMWTPVWGGHQVKKVETEEPAVKSEAQPEATPAVETPAASTPEKTTPPADENKDDKKPDTPKDDAPATPATDADVKKAEAPTDAQVSDPNAIKEEVRPDVQQPAEQTTEPRKPQAEGDATTVNVDESQDKKTEAPAETKAEDVKKDEAAPAPATDADIQKAESAPAEQTAADKPADNDAEKTAAKPSDEKAQAEEKSDTKADVKTDEKAADATVKDSAEESDKKEKVVETDEPESSPLTLGLVVHNVLGGTFTLSKMVNKDATDTPTQMYRVIDIGSQYRLYAGEDLTIRYMLDFKDLLHPEINFNKAFHTGLEFDYSPSTWFKTQFRVGVNQMYYTAGASFLFGIFNIDVATYGEEVGTSSTRVENRVCAAKVGMNF